MAGLSAAPSCRPRTLTPSRPVAERRHYDSVSSGSGISESNRLTNRNSLVVLCACSGSVRAAC
eukprot:3935113-Rhodomonas_salina.6